MTVKLREDAVEEREENPSMAALFVERFDDFFARGVFPSIALGLVLTLVWMGLTEGYPIFMNGRVDLPSVMVMLGSFALLLLVMALVPAARGLLRRSGAWVGAGGLMAVASVALLVLYFAPSVVDAPLRMLVIRVLMAPIGLSMGVLVMACATAFACLRPVSAGVGFTFAITVTFAVYFCLNACERHISGALFCLLPVAAALMLLRERVVIVDRLEEPPVEDLGLASGFRSMCLSFCVFFFAIGAKCAMEPPAEFSLATDTSVIGILAVSLVFLYLIGLRARPVGVFRVLKVFYSTAVMVLTVCIALAPLSLEPYMGVVYNGDVMVIIMVLWLLTAFVAQANEAPVCRVVGLAFGAAALGMMLGWLAGVSIYQLFGHERSYPTIAIACATAVFSTIGFSSKNFPCLTHRGEGAKKMMKVAAAYNPADYCHEVAERFHLSGREEEVLALLVAGYGADAVAEKLVISYHTARTHVRNIYRKMDIHSQRELLDSFDAAKEERLEDGA